MGEEMETATAESHLVAAGFVLAGGRSSRMGADKAQILLEGQPLLSHALGILREAGLTAFIAGGQASLSAFAPLIKDDQPGRGPLSGICASLASTSASFAVFLSVDLPLLPSSLVRCLLQHAMITGGSITLPSINGFAQSFPAVISRTALPILKEELDSGRGGCYSAFQTAAAGLGQPIHVLPVETLVQCGHVAHPCGLPTARWFLNVNTGDDLRRAAIHAQHAHRVS
jgi:molybdopterin-guanine dinucleotide biosynthesis protein A